MTTGIGVGATGAIDDYLYCLTCGETHEQALRSAAINGPIEGVTTGGLKFIGNAVANKVKARTSMKGPDANIVRDNSAHNAALFEKLKQDLAVEEVQSVVRTTEHGVQRLMTRGFSPEEIVAVRTSPSKVLLQSDGAQVFIKRLDSGKFNIIVEGQNGVVTALKDIGEKSLKRLSENYSWK